MNIELTIDQEILIEKLYSTIMTDSVNLTDDQAYEALVTLTNKFKRDWNI